MAETDLTGGVAAVPEFRPATSDIFANRAKRLRDLARGHAMAEYLRFAAALVEAQATQFGSLIGAALPDEAHLEHCRAHGLPPLSVDSLSLEGLQQILTSLLDTLPGEALPAKARPVIGALHEMDRAELERSAASVLAGSYSDIDAAFVPFIGAALQLFWTKAAFELGSRGQSPGVDVRQCPVCGSPPVVGIIRSGGAEHGLRYLACSVCASEWHLVRVKCSACTSTKSISYLYVEGANDAIRAECCDECETYLKLLYLERDRHMEALADDLASFALDVLVDEQGYRRLAPNLLFAPGADA